MKHYDVVVVGAGQAGLAMGYYLKRENLTFILLDSNDRIGESWRRRYDTLKLFTPRKFSSLPGLLMNGPLEGVPTKDEMADYLERYMFHFDIPVRFSTNVTGVIKNDEIFRLETNQGPIEANQVVIASGAFQKAFIPPVIQKSPKNAFQIHSSAYTSPYQLEKGSVLVVGGGNSGAQIAVELSRERKVTLAVSYPFKFLPFRVLGKSIFSWLDFLGLLYAGVNTNKGKWFRKQRDPIFGLELKQLIRNNKIYLMPKVVEVKGNNVIFERNRRQSFENIVWATGFIPSYDWIRIAGVTSASGHPIQKRGISSINGLYFLGLPWQHQRGSALVCGVGRDAKYLIPYINEGNSAVRSKSFLESNV